MPSAGQKSLAGKDAFHPRPICPPSSGSSTAVLCPPSPPRPPHSPCEKFVPLSASNRAKLHQTAPNRTIEIAPRQQHSEALKHRKTETLRSELISYLRSPPSDLSPEPPLSSASD